jgi:hypothetical protein
MSFFNGEGADLYLEKNTEDPLFNIISYIMAYPLLIQVGEVRCE